MRLNHLFISNSDANTEFLLTIREIFKFLRSCVLFIFIPTFIAICFIEWVAWRAGVTVPPHVLAEAQNKDPNVLAISSDGMQYYAAQKLVRIAYEQPEIVIIGSSRCNETRSNIFEPYKMYNACVTAWTFKQIHDFLKNISAVAHPKIVIFTLDYFMFTDEYESVWETKAAQVYHFTLRSHLNGLHRLGSAYKASPIATLKDIKSCLFKRKRSTVDNLKLMGFDSIHSEAGFRHDGTMFYDRSTRAAAANSHKDRLYGLLNAVTGAPQMSTKQIASLKKLADFAHSQEITLVGIQYPILGTTVEYLETNKQYWQYAGVWREFQSNKTKKMLKDLGIYFFDLSHDSINKDSRNFIDSAHVTEAGVLGAITHHLNDKDFRAIFPKLNRIALRNKYAEAQMKREYLDVYHQQS